MSWGLMNLSKRRLEGAALKDSELHADLKARVRGASFSFSGLVPYRRNDLSRSFPDSVKNRDVGKRRVKIVAGSRRRPACRATN